MNDMGITPPIEVIRQWGERIAKVNRARGILLTDLESAYKVIDIALALRVAVEKSNHSEQFSQELEQFRVSYGKFQDRLEESKQEQLEDHPELGRKDRNN